MTSRRLTFALLVGVLCSCCAMVTVSSLGPEQYIAMRRGDILSAGRLSAATRDTLRVAALDDNACQLDPQDCIDSIATVAGIDPDQRLASLAELSLQTAMAQTPNNNASWSDAQFDLWLRTVQYAYAFLFYGQRAAGERASKIGRRRSATTTTTQPRNSRPPCSAGVGSRWTRIRAIPRSR